MFLTVIKRGLLRNLAKALNVKVGIVNGNVENSLVIHIKSPLMKIARKSPYFNGEMDRAYLILVINPFTCLTHAIFLTETTLSFGWANNLTYTP